MTENNEDEEILDLVDESDEVVGTISHNQAYSKDGLNGRYIRAASCFLMNSDGKLWIPRRLPTKKIAPNGLDYSAGGHVASGETYDEAMVRELAEELNIQVSSENLVLVGKELPQTTPPHYYFSQVYLYKSDVPPTFNTDDFVGFEWLDIDTLRQRLLDGEPAKSSLLVSIDLLSTYVAQNSSDQQRH